MEYPNRQSTRLPAYDYSEPGYYFVTICTQGRKYLFGNIIDDQMFLNDYGLIVENCWLDIPIHFKNVALDQFIIMPNHFHGIIEILDVGVGLRPTRQDEQAGHRPVRTNRAGHRPAPTRPGLPNFICAFKSYSSQRINIMRDTSGQSVWQRNYYEHVIRDEDDLNRIRQYIIDNPINWEKDELFVECALSG